MSFVSYLRSPSRCVCTLIHTLILCLIVTPVRAQEIVYPAETPLCTYDINGNGDTSEDDEIAICPTGQIFNPLTNLPGPATSLYCPLGQAACVASTANICSIDGTACDSDSSTSCSRPSACTRYNYFEGGEWFIAFDCPATPEVERYPEAGMCSDACEETGSCEVESAGYECPLGEYDCINQAAGDENYYCSVSACATYEDAGVYEPVVDSYTVNDGTITDDGCIDNIEIFNGKAESCRLPGAASAYQNCCQETSEEMLSDSSGSAAESVAYAEGIAALYEAGTAAYAAYSGAIAGGSTTGAAAASSASAFQSSLVTTLSSTTVIVGVIIIAVVAYLENACPPEGVVTAIKKKAGQCVLIGEKCTTSIMGSCVQKAEVHCCFNTLMATLVQKGGRAQLGMDFGTVDAPNCRGFTPEEFQSIDFSKIDLTEYYEELKYRAQSDIENEITTVISDVASDI